MGGTPSRFVRALSAAETDALRRLAHEHPGALGRRARAILRSAERVPIATIARELGVSRVSLAAWMRRFERAGVAGLQTRPRSGRPPKITSEVVRHLVRAIGARPRALGMDGTTWTIRSLRRYLVKAGVVQSISAESLRGILRTAGLSLTTVHTRLIQKGTTTMIPAKFEYHAPSSIDEATALLARLGGDAKVLSGGQSLIPLMKLRLASPPHLVDINGIPGLSYIREADGALRIGALTRESELEDSEIIRTRYPLLHDTCGVIADPLVRNLATVGGNLAHADPANDHPATMLALGAEVVAVGTRGERRIPVSAFFTGPFETALTPDEILVEVRVPNPPARSGGAYLKLERKVGDFATAAVAAQVALASDGTCAQVGIGLTNVGLTPIRATAAEDALRGKRPDDTALARTAALAAEAARPSADLRGSVEYKKDLVRVLTTRALRKALERAGGRR